MDVIRTIQSSALQKFSELLQTHTEAIQREITDKALFITHANIGSSVSDEWIFMIEDICYCNTLHYCKVG